VSPGSTGGPIRRALECTARRPIIPGQLDLIYCPEFVQLGNVISGAKHPFAVLAGMQDPSVTSAALNELLVCAQGTQIVRMTWEEAELAKIGLNCALSLKPVLANTLAPICNHYGANVDRVTDFIGLDPRIGPKLLRAGLHPGGPCLPRDIRALLAAGEETHTIALASSIDTLGKWETHRWYEFLTKIALRHFGWPSPRDVGILGETYKPGVLVTEEAFGDKLWRELNRRDCKMIPSCDSTRNSQGEVGRTIRAATIIVLTLMDPALKEILESGVDLKNKVIVDPWRYLDPEKLHCLAYYGGLE
jgi:UDPglucose 6-dehydrogenase